jgi:hypothetical protein
MGAYVNRPLISGKISDKNEKTVNSEHKKEKEPEKCEGWDSNPRTPARPGPEPGAVDLAWLPSRHYRLPAGFNKCRVRRKLLFLVGAGLPG